MRQPYTIGPVLAYHGCDRAIARNVLDNEANLILSENHYDWLGPGIYFWVDSPIHALAWAMEKKNRGSLKNPYVIGAYITLGNCLNLTDLDALQEVKEAYAVLQETSVLSGQPLPANRKKAPDGTHIFRDLDCRVIQTLHQLRKDKGRTPYDTVLGVFEEGGALFEGSALREKTHIQIAVLNRLAIINYFPVRGIDREFS